MGILPKGEERARRGPPPPPPPIQAPGKRCPLSASADSLGSPADLSPPDSSPPGLSTPSEPASPRLEAEEAEESVDSSYASSTDDCVHQAFPSTSGPPREPTGSAEPGPGSGRRPSASCQAIRDAVSELFRLDDFHCEVLGDGYFSLVYKVLHRSTGQVMVLKRGKPGRSSKESDLREIQLLRRFDHDNLIRLKGVCVEEAGPDNARRWRLHALTEFCDAGNLDALIQSREKALAWRSRVSLCLDVARGMRCVHDLGYLHRDLTAVNVLLKREASRLVAVVADFGLAVRRPEPGQRLTQATGNPYWRAPECLSEKPYDAAADVFSFGVICLQLIGWMEADPDLGFPRTSSFGIDYLKFPAPDDTPAAFLSLAFSCCLMDPDSRPTFAGAEAELLDEWTALNRASQAQSDLERSRSHTNFRRPDAAAGFVTRGVPAFEQALPPSGPSAPSATPGCSKAQRSRFQRRTAPENCVRAAMAAEAAAGRPRNLSLAAHGAELSVPTSEASCLAPSPLGVMRKPSKLVAESIAASDPFYEPSDEAVGNPFFDSPHDQYLRRPRKDTPLVSSTNSSVFVHSISVNEEESDEEDVPSAASSEAREAKDSPDTSSTPTSSRLRPVHGHAKSGLVPLRKKSSEGTPVGQGIRKCFSFPASPPPRLGAREGGAKGAKASLPSAQAPAHLKEVAQDMSIRDEAFVDPVAEKARRSTLTANAQPPEATAGQGTGRRRSDFALATPPRDVPPPSPSPSPSPSSSAKAPLSNLPTKSHSKCGIL